MDDNKLSKIILQYKPKRQSKFSWLYSIPYRKVENSYKKRSKRQQSEKRERARVGKHIREVKIRVV
jgi:hypothetical protein